MNTAIDTPPDPVEGRLDEGLEDGWSPSTPLDDTLLHHLVHGVAAATAVPAVAMGARSVERDDLVATDIGEWAGYWNAATVLVPLGPASWSAALDRIEGFFDGHGSPRTVELWSPFSMADLRPRGWELSGHPPLMWRPAGTPPGRSAPVGMEIRRATKESAVHEWAVTAAEAFPMDGTPSAVANAALLDDPRVHLFTAFVGNTPVGVSSTVVTHGVNTVPAVAVKAEARGSGYGEALTWAATLVQPDLPAALVASDDGRPIYARMGYVALARWTLWQRRFGEPPRGERRA